MKRELKSATHSKKCFIYPVYLGKMSIHQKNFDAAKKSLENGIKKIQKLTGMNNPNLFPLLFSRASINVTEGNINLAEKSLKIIIKQSNGRNEMAIVDSLTALAEIYFSKSDYLNASIYFKRALLITKKFNGPNDIDVIVLKNKFDSALQCFSKILYTNDCVELYIPINFNICNIKYGICII